MSSPKGLVLVTGANGFIGARTVEALLAAGYSVRAAVRSPASAAELLNALPQQTESGLLSAVLVPDITAPGAFDEAVRGAAAIAHLASPVALSAHADVEATLGAAVKGTTGILDSALKEPGLRSFVFMSSIAAVCGRGEKYLGRSITEADWNDEAEDAFEESGRAPGPAVYAVSKIRAERAFWEFREKKKKKNEDEDEDEDAEGRSRRARFTMTSINPVWVSGPPLILPEDPEKLSVTANVPYRVMAGQELPPVGPGNGTHVDVRDVARLMVFAVDEAAAADGQRFIAGGNGNVAKVQAYYDVLRRAYPDRRDVIFEGNPGEGYHADYSWILEERRVDASKTYNATGRGWIPFEQSILDAAKAYERYF